MTNDAYFGALLVMMSALAVWGHAERLAAWSLDTWYMARALIPRRPKLEELALYKFLNARCEVQHPDSYWFYREAMTANRVNVRCKDKLPETYAVSVKKAVELQKEAARRWRIEHD